MRIGAGIFLIAVGAVLDFAVDATVSGVNIHTVGLILMVVGVVGIVFEALVALPRRRTSRTVVDDGVHEPTVVRRDQYV